MSSLDEKKAYLYKSYKLKPNDTRSKEYCLEYNEKMKQQIDSRAQQDVEKEYRNHVEYRKENLEKRADKLQTMIDKLDELLL
jgi:hypothetical protein